jgi:hypothetical protein
MVANPQESEGSEMLGVAEKPVRVTINVMHTCARCAVMFDVRKSHAVLKYTYCGVMCENADLGFSLEEWTR